jgi:hypothetical protein
VPRRGHAAALLVAAALALAAPAAADPSARLIGVLRIDASGVSDTAEQRFEQGVVDGLTGAGFRVMDRTSFQRALAGSAGYVGGCTFGPCLRAVQETTGVDTVLVARIEGVGRTYGFVVSLLDTRTGRLSAQVAQRCPVCTVEDAITTATLSAVELVLGEGGAASASPVRIAPPDRAASRVAVARSLRRFGWTGLVLGLGAAAVGGVALARDEPTWGAGLIGAGAALATGGAVMIGFGGRLD